MGEDAGTRRPTSSRPSVNTTVPEPNLQLRTARERTPSRKVPGTRMSREELADAVAQWIVDRDPTSRDVAFDANHLGKLERGTVRRPRPIYVAALCAVLRATEAELGFTHGDAALPHVTETAQQVSAEPAAPTSTATPQATQPGKPHDDKPEPQPLSGPSGLWHPDSCPNDDEQAAIELARRVAASDVSDETLTRLEQAVDELATVYPSSQPQELLGRVRTYLSYVTTLVDARKTLDGHRRLLTVGSWLSLLAATLHIDLERQSAATAHLKTAVALAKQTEHDELIGWCLETEA